MTGERIAQLIRRLDASIPPTDKRLVEKPFGFVTEATYRDGSHTARKITAILISRRRCPRELYAAERRWHRRWIHWLREARQPKPLNRAERRRMAAAGKGRR